MGITNVLQTGNQLITNYDVSKLFLGENERISVDFTGTGAALAAGLVMGRIAATQKVVAWAVAATDGSEIPIGILDLGIVASRTFTAATAYTLNLVNKGRVAESKISGVDIDTIITGQTIRRTGRDILNDIGIILEGGVELTKVDNS